MHAARTKAASLALPLVLLTLPGCIIHIDGDGAWRGGYGFRSASFDGPRVHGNGIRGTQDREVDLDGVETVHLCGSIDARIQVGTGPSVKLTGDENILRHVEVERDGDDLVVGLEDGTYEFEVPLAIEIALPELEGVVIAGASDVDVAGLDGEDFSVVIRGAGDVRLDGRVEELDVEVSGSGDVDARSVQARSARVEIHGSGDVDLPDIHEISVSINGSGDVSYRGQPEHRDVDVRGSGSVHAAR